MILILFCFINVCSGSYQGYNSVSPYQTFLTGPYWTYPVNKEPLIHRPSYFSNFEHIRLKRDTVENDHEFPKDIPTKPNQENKGSWAKGKIPGKEIDVGFVPIQLYTQVRRYDTVKHLPRSAALEEASTDEEVAAAPRLREVLSHKKIQQVYEEEGYEDSGYDHGGYNHQGAKYEDNEKNDEVDSEHVEDPQIRGAEGVLVYTNPNGRSNDPPMIGSFKNQITVSNQKSSKYDEGDEISVLLEEAPPKVEGSRGKYVLIDGRKVPIYKNTIKNKPESEERSREKLEESRESVEMIETAQSRSGVDDEAEVRVVNDPRPKGSNTVTFPGRHTRRQYAIGRLTENWSPMAPADVFVQESVGYNVRRPFYPGVPVTHNVHHYVPLVPFPNFYSDNPTSYASPHIKPKPKPSNTQFSSASTLNTFSQLLSSNETTTTSTTTTLPPIIEPRPNKTDYIDIIQPRFNSTIDLRPNRINFGRGRHYNNFTRHTTPRSEQARQPNWNFNRHLLNIRHPSLPRDNNEDMRPFAGALKSEPEARFYENGPVKYIEQLTVAHYSSLENKPLKNSPNNQTGRLIALARELNARAKLRKKRDAAVSYDAEKYPFYRRIAGREKGNRDSALKYATNPDQIPKKTGAMDFYDSKDKLVKCDEPNLPEDIVPERDEDGEWNKNPQPEMPRLKGLGDMIQCNKNKYFGKEPLDNPFFQEDIDPPKYEPDDEIEIQKPIFNKKRKGENTKRLIVLTKPENMTKNKNYSNHKMNYDNISVTFPYKNHKPEAELTNYRITTPYSYYNGENQYSTYENPDEGDSYTESTKKHHHYRPYYPYRHKHIHKRKRFRPNRQPVSIYSIISHNGYPNYYNRPLILAHSMNTNKIIPLYPVGATTQSTDNLASDTEEFPTKYYIIRPGEYTENKDLAADKKETSSIWSYMNPMNRLRWWFPSLFDNRRKEPKYRKRRDSEYMEESNYETDHKPQTTGPPISLSEFKIRMNISENTKPQMRLTGGYRNYATEPTTRSLEAPTAKPKVLFPRTKTPMRKPISYNYNIPTEAKFVHTTTTTAPTTTKMSRMYKPKRIIDKSFRKPIDAFDILKPKTTENPESPRRMQVEHRRVTKEEVYKTSFVPDKSGESEPVSKNSENKTLTYMVNPETGVGTWKEEPRIVKKTKWRPKKKKLKNETKTRTSPKRSVKRQREIADDEAYVLGLMSKLPTPDLRYYPKKKISKPSELNEEYVDAKLPTHFILDPGKRKYYYVND